MTIVSPDTPNTQSQLPPMIVYAMTSQSASLPEILVTSVPVATFSAIAPDALSTTGALSLILLTSIITVAASEKTPSLPLIVKAYHVADS
jgi:hypothetical protein